MQKNLFFFASVRQTETHGPRRRGARPPGPGDRLPLPPDPALDPVLDAATECLARHGISKTTLSDIAREMGVAPSTVYRKVGSVDNVTMLVFAREAQRFLERIPATLTDGHRDQPAITHAHGRRHHDPGQPPGGRQGPA